MTERKAIFVTGAASGIGQAVAHHFAARGWFVGLGDINQEGMAHTAILAGPGKSASYVLDVRSRDDWARALADFWEKAGGRLDVLFNNAGIGRGGNFHEVTAADNDLMIDVNLYGVVRGAEAAFPYLRKTPGSCLLNTSSAAGIYGPAGLAVYGATKAAVRGLTEALDTEWEEYGIKVRSLMPGFIDTPILDHIQAGSNRSGRDAVKEAGFEISEPKLVAEAAMAAIKGSTLHTLVGPTAKRAAFVSRYFPGFFRRQASKVRAATTGSGLR